MRFTSASRIKDFRSCQRLWYYTTIVKAPQPEKESLKEGTRLHEEIERYLLSGDVPENPSIRYAIQKGIIPRHNPSAGYMVEEPKNFNLGIDIEGVRLRGKVDFQAPVSPTGPIEVRDWKTASSFRYVPDPDSLSRDIQCAIYLAYGFSKAPEKTQGIFSHVYLLRNRTGVKVVETDVLEKEYVDSFIQDVLAPTVRSMKVVSQAGSAEDVEGSPSACNKYGGCPYKISGLCSIPKMHQSTSDKWMEAFDASSKGKEEDMAGQDLMALIKARKAAKAETDSTAKKKPVAVATGVNPPDAPPPAVLENKEPVVEAVGVVKAVEESKPEKPKARKPRASKKAEAVEAAEEKKEEGLFPAGLFASDQPQEEGLRIFVNCSPLKSDRTVVLLADLIEERQEACIEQIRKIEPSAIPEGCTDVRQIPFAKGESAMVLSFRNVPPEGVDVVATNVGVSAKVLEVLIPKATVVVYG